MGQPFFITNVTMDGALKTVTARAECSSIALQAIGTAIDLYETSGAAAAGTPKFTIGAGLIFSMDMRTLPGTEFFFKQGAGTLQVFELTGPQS